MALQNFSLISLSNVLEKDIKIPYYQREYSWEKSECEDLWEDLEEVVSSENDNKHFFGQLVFHSKPGSLEIIDGQQRMTTSVLLLTAFSFAYRDMLSGIEDTHSTLYSKMSRRSGVFEEKLGIDTTETNYLNIGPHLSQNDSDNDYYLRILVRDIQLLKKKAAKKSQERLRKAYNYFADQIRTLIKGKSISEKKEILEKWMDSFISKFQVMYIEATELSEAFTIFESLNARGKDLASSDLLKSHLFTTSRDIEQSNKKWNKMLDQLEGADVTKYIRAYWNSEQPFIRTNTLFKTISSWCKDTNKSKDFLDKLSDCSVYYHDLAQPENATVFSSDRIINALVGLRTLGASSFYPIVLAMVKRKVNGDPYYNESQIALVCETIESYVFRNAAICGQTANKTEIAFAKIAKKISDEELNDVSEIKQDIKNEMVDDNAFEDSFMNYETTNKERIRYIYRKIHKYLDRTNELNINNSEVHIEHIMPEDASLWPDISESTHEEYLWRIGNLCLLSGPLNSSISNKSFADKKELAYKDSKIEPNKDLMDYESWSEKSIVDRQGVLFEYAVKIWQR